MRSVFNPSVACVMALRACAVLCKDHEKVVSTPRLAASIGASEMHLAKVMQMLTRAGIVDAFRGVSGGFRIKRADAPVIDVVQVIDGAPRAQCPFGHTTPDCCALGNLVQAAAVNLALELHEIKLDSLAAYGL